MGKTITTLGPAGTFTEAAADLYASKVKVAVHTESRAVFKLIFDDVSQGKYDFGLVPIENLLDGYVGLVLDLLLEYDLFIIDEVIYPIQFAFISNSKSLTQVKTIYAQFVTQGQCRNFLEKMSKISVITTESNGKSIEQIEKKVKGEGSIVPSFILKQKGRFDIDNCFKINNVTDFDKNETRFIVLAKKEDSFDPKKKYKTSLAVTKVADRSGALLKILKAFSDREINLTSISSRPTKNELGKYHFLIDLEGHKENKIVKDALSEIAKENIVKIFGSYPIAK